MLRTALIVVLLASCSKPKPSDPDTREIIDTATKGLGKLDDLAREEHQREAEATRKLEAIVVEVDKLIADQAYEKAYLEASKIHWPYHDLHDRERVKDFDDIRQARLTIIERHLH